MSFISFHISYICKFVVIEKIIKVHFVTTPMRILAHRYNSLVPSCIPSLQRYITIPLFLCSVLSEKALTQVIWSFWTEEGIFQVHIILFTFCCCYTFHSSVTLCNTLKISYSHFHSGQDQISWVSMNVYQFEITWATYRTILTTRIHFQSFYVCIFFHALLRTYCSKIN